MSPRMHPQATALLAIDWGTSALRGARLNTQGDILEQRSFARGVLSVAAGEFQAVFDACFGDWTGATAAPCLISGMAGSKQGWVEAPYCPCPAGFGDLAGRLMWLPQAAERAPVALVPGLCCEQPGAVAGLPHVPDVMRGEEVQIFGAMQLTGLRDGVFVLPGTHSKWASVEDGRVTGFRTFMSGEVFALLGKQSILSRTVDADATLDRQSFALGVLRAQQPGGLLHHAFGARTLSLFSRMQAPALGSYLSGLVIGEELAAQDLRPGSQVVVIGAPALTERYAQALALHEVRSTVFDAQATWAGLRGLAAALVNRRT